MGSMCTSIEEITIFAAKDVNEFEFGRLLLEQPNGVQVPVDEITYWRLKSPKESGTKFIRNDRLLQHVTHRH